jgi:hypothetical protein
MLRITRGVSTLIGAAVAGTLLWVASQLNEGTNGGYWATYGIVAAAGVAMALSQLFGGWTKWGLPQISLNVFLIGFLPVLFTAGWVLVASQPHASWARDHVQAWSADIGVRDVVFDVNDMIAALAFGVGLVFGFCFDTTGPRVRRAATQPPARAPASVTRDADAPTTAERTEVGEERPVAWREPERGRVPSRE